MKGLQERRRVYKSEKTAVGGTLEEGKGARGRRKWKSAKAGLEMLKTKLIFSFFFPFFRQKAIIYERISDAFDFILGF